MARGTEFGEYYTIPVLLAFDGIDKQVNSGLGRQLDSKMGKVGESGGQAYAKSFGQSSEKDLKKAFDNHAKLADRAADATGKLKTAEAGLQDLRDRGITSGQRVTRATEAIEKARRDETRAIKNAEEALKDYERAAKRAERAGKDAGDGFTSGLRQSSGGSSFAGVDAADSFGDGFSGAMSVARFAGPIGAALGGAGIIAGGLLASELASEFEKQIGTDLIQAQLGLSESEIAGLGSAAGAAWADNFGESTLLNLDTAKFALQAGILGDANDPAMQKVIEQLTTVSMLLGEDVPEAARAAGQLMKTGLAKNATEAFDIIAGGQQKGLNMSGDWLDTLNEYGVQFQKLGISGPEAVGLITQALQGGARDTDVAADAIKEFSIRAVDGSDSTKEAFEAMGFNAEEMTAKFAAGGPAAHDAFGQILTAVNSIEDPVEKARIGVQLFGTQYEDLGPAFDRLNLKTAAEREFGGVANASQKAADTMSANSANEWELAKRNIIGKINEIKAALDFGDWFKSIPQGVNDFLDDQGQGQSAIGWLLGGDEPRSTDPIPGGGGPNAQRQRRGLDPYDPTGGLLLPQNPPRRAAGGEIRGPGGPKEDLIPIWGSNGEHMLPADEVDMLGGQAGVYAHRSLIRAGVFGKFANGGAIGPDVDAALSMAGTPYSQGARNDCSGMVARVIARTMGLPESGLMSTKNAVQWLSELGFQPGIGGPGQISVGWYDNGPNPNDGHMAMTLSDGTNAEAGGQNGVFTVGAGAAGADDPKFDQQMFLPTVYGEGVAGSASGMSFGGSSGGGGGTAGYGPNGEAGTYSVDQRDVQDANARVRESDAKVREAEARQRELEADAKESEKIRAQADVDKAKADAGAARDELAEAQRGKFTPGKSTDSKDADLGEIGSIASSFLKETFGIDLSNNPLMKMLDVGLNAFSGPLADALPGANPTAAGTSPSPFGLPEVAVPPVPAPGVHGGSGAAPGPVTNVSVDQSINGGQFGWGHDDIEKQREQRLHRAIPRIPIGS